jgi:hypothetical protein
MDRPPRRSVVNVRVDARPAPSTSSVHRMDGTLVGCASLIPELTHELLEARPSSSRVSRPVGEKYERPVGEVEAALDCACSKKVLK